MLEAVAPSPRLGHPAPMPDPRSPSSRSAGAFPPSTCRASSRRRTRRASPERSARCCGASACRAAISSAGAGSTAWARCRVSPGRGATQAPPPGRRERAAPPPERPARATACDRRTDQRDPAKSLRAPGDDPARLGGGRRRSARRGRTRGPSCGLRPRWRAIALIVQPRFASAWASTSSPCVSMEWGSPDAVASNTSSIGRGPRLVGGSNRLPGRSGRSDLGRYSDQLWGDSAHPR